MHLQYHPFALYLFLSSLIALASSAMAWRRRAPGAQTLGILLFALAVWSAADAVQWLQTDLRAKVILLDIMMLGAASSPALFLLFSLKFTQLDVALRRRHVALLFVVPVAAVLLVWTNNLHHLVFSSIGIIQKDGFILIRLERGTWFYVNAIFSYLLIIVGGLLLFHASLRSSPLFRNQYRILLLGSLIPFVLSLYSQFHFSSLNEFDLAPMAFGITGLLFLFALLKTGFMDLVPVARSHLIENMQDGVLVVDSQNRIMDFNPAMEKILGGIDPSSLGKPASEVLGDWFEDTEALLQGLESQTEMRIPNSPSRYLDLRMTPLYDKYQQLNGRLIVFRDVTDRKDTERKLRQANRRLGAQLIEICMLQSQLREQAIRDPLTNLFNRRYLEETLDRELARAARESYPVCIIMIDIDHFKQVNDTYGHEAGDFVLKALAGMLLQHSRRGDFACRLGGEEFIIVMPNINHVVARERAEKLQKSLRAMRVSYGQYDLAATYSMGIAAFPANGGTRDAILHAADMAMYAAKHAGRDHIRSFDQIETIRE